ncbi:hypothetical protein [Winogradskyella sp.]|uniref:hypothetical protein n=1 Tax=Winogradskyella sp. TaxID=1883156 RepID=UPI003F6C728A
MKKFITTLVLYSITFTLFHCSSSKYKLQKESVLSPKGPYFQTWTAGIRKGGSGYHIYFPNLNPDEKVTMDSVYFRDLKAKLVKGAAMYKAQLNNPPSPYDRDMSIEAANKKEEKPFFPFELNRMECVISYIESGEIKYLKISKLREKEGVYYPEGSPNNL